MRKLRKEFCLKLLLSIMCLGASYAHAESGYGSNTKINQECYKLIDAIANPYDLKQEPYKPTRGDCDNFDKTCPNRDVSPFRFGPHGIELGKGVPKNANARYDGVAGACDKLCRYGKCGESLPLAGNPVRQ